MPFTDIIVQQESCSGDYPDEVIYDVWLGTILACDCISEDDVYHPQIKCKQGGGGRDGNKGRHSDCHGTVGALAPVV